MTSESLVSTGSSTNGVLNRWLCRVGALRRAATVALVALLALSGTFGASDSASASSDLSASGSTTPTTAPNSKPIVTFGIQPATSRGPDGRGYFGFSSTPGGRYTDHIAVTDYAYQPISLTLHPTDAVNTPEGDFALLPPNSSSPHFAPWIKLPPQDITLNVPARGTVIVPFDLAVPQSATPGDHIGGIIATLQSYVTSPSGQRIQLLQSVGTRIFIRVSGPLRPGFTIDGLTARYRGTANPIGSGRVQLTYVVHNTGNVALGGQQTVWVSGLFGSKTYAKTLPRVQLLLPGFSVRERVAFSSVFPELLMTGHVSISPLIIPGSQQPPSGPYRSTVRFWAVPWLLVIIAAVIILGIAGWLVMRRRRRRQPHVVAENPEPGGLPSNGKAADDVIEAEPLVTRAGEDLGHEVVAEPAVEDEIAPVAQGLAERGPVTAAGSAAPAEGEKGATLPRKRQSIAQSAGGSPPALKRAVDLKHLDDADRAKGAFRRPGSRSMSKAPGSSPPDPGDVA